MVPSSLTPPAAAQVVGPGRRSRSHDLCERSARAPSGALDRGDDDRGGVAGGERLPVHPGRPGGGRCDPDHRHQRRQPAHLTADLRPELADVGPGDRHSHHPAAPGRQPLDGLQLGDQRLQRRQRLLLRERRLPVVLDHPGGGRQAHPDPGPRHGRHRPGHHPGGQLRGRRRAGPVQRAGPAQLPGPALRPERAHQGLGLLAHPQHDRRQGVPGRVRQLAEAGGAWHPGHDPARQRARPVELDAPRGPSPAGHLCRAGLPRRRVRRRRQEGVAIGEGHRPGQLRLRGLHHPAERQRFGGRRQLRGLVPRGDEPGLGRRRPPPHRRPRRALVPRGHRGRSTHHRRRLGRRGRRGRGPRASAPIAVGPHLRRGQLDHR